MRQLVQIIALSLTFLAKCSSNTDIGIKIGDKAFDYLVFSQQWPQTGCIVWKEKSEKNSCFLPRNVTAWTIHGLWPSDYSGPSPENCNKHWKFNATALIPILSELEEVWPNIYGGSELNEFWAHEWNKHGTCAAKEVTGIFDEFSYFSSGIELNKRTNMEMLLWNNSLIPDDGKQYDISSFENAIKNDLGVSPIIVCYKDKNTTNHLIQEIRICMDKTLSLLDCPSEMKAILTLEQNCPKNGTIVYPVIRPTNFTTPDWNSDFRYEL